MEKCNKHVKGLRHKIYAPKLYHLNSDTFESNRGCISTCIGTVDINWDDLEQFIFYFLTFLILKAFFFFFLWLLLFPLRFNIF